ncbi:MAG: glutaredoxin family protein [Mycobacterium leprae]
MGDLHVTLYSGPTNEELALARRFLEERGIQYEEKNVVESTGARGELEHYTGRGDYPSINVDGHVVSGFAPEKWEHLLMTNLRRGR